jgi:hypothetical protein|tara:strand:+ start:928 stop:1374 length:447 start_codon:yes stop_codon:yes gene_type:complete
MNKKELVSLIENRIEERMAAAKIAMDAAQASANEQGKSSMGDKYETSRSMGQLDRNMFAQQYETARVEMTLLQRIQYLDHYSVVIPGSLVQTTTAWFFITVSLGKVLFEQTEIMVISGASPIGKSLIGLGIGAEILFLGKKEKVLNIM